MLNREVLHVAAKYLEADISSDSLFQFLTLGIKASLWCGKHLKMTLMSAQESQEEEHSNLFFQLLSEMLSFSAFSFSVLTRYPLSKDMVLMKLVENFILEQLKLAKDTISEIKKIHLCGSEVQKVAQVVIDAVIKLCLAYSQAINWELTYEKPEEDRITMDCEGRHDANHVINVFKCTIEKLCELGIVAANGGGSLVTILNVSWKGVVTLLQHGKGVLAKNINVASVIRTLISLVIEPLRYAAEAWSSSLKESVSVIEARRTFVPVKFYLINAVKLSSLYPCQAHLIYREVILCILMIYTFKILLSNAIYLKTANEVMTELLEETSLDLLKSLLNSGDVKLDLKLDILDSLFTYESFSTSIHGDPSVSYRISSLSDVLSVSCEAMNGARTLLLGRVALLLNLLAHSHDLGEDMKSQITRKLKWFLDMLVDEDVYTSILVLQIPVLSISGKTTELIWQSLLSSIVLAMKSFVIVVSSTLAWRQVEELLVENFFHPHFLCWEVVMELWCFVLRYADPCLVNGVFDNLISLLKMLSSSEEVFNPGSALRKVARSISMLLTYGAKSMVNDVYNSIVGEENSQFSSVMCVALFMEGFPLDLLSDKMKSIAVKRILTHYYGFIESYNGSSTACFSSQVSSLSVFALSSSLQSLQVSVSDIDARTLTFLVDLIRNYDNSEGQEIKDHCCKLLGGTLGILSYMKNLYASDVMEKVISELEKLFVSGTTASDSQLYQCIPDLAHFMAGLAHMEMAETDDNAKISAVRGLYHMLLRERHWAFVHLALTAFGYFAQRTSCNELWRFVPQNAALSYDLASGNELNEEGFMANFRVFLEKEVALLTVTPSTEQLDQLVREGLILKEMFKKNSNLRRDSLRCESKEVDGKDNSNKKRKLPDRISEGVELLKSSLKVIGDGLSQWPQNHLDSTEFHNKFLVHFSRLEEEASHLLDLAGADRIGAFSPLRESHLEPPL